MANVFGNVVRLVAYFVSVLLNLILGRQYKSIASILFDCLVDVGLWVEAKVWAAPTSATQSIGAFFCLGEGLNLRVCDFWDAWEVQALTSVFLAEGKWPHPELASQHLLHIL